MNKERYNQIIDEVYEKYITQIRIEFEKWCERNPHTLVNYREDTKELFLKSIKEDTHWFTGEKNFSDKWGLKIEERELSESEIWDYIHKNDIKIKHQHAVLYSHEVGSELRSSFVQTLKENYNIPTKLITVTYKNEKTEIYE